MFQCSEDVAVSFDESLARADSHKCSLGQVIHPSRNSPALGGTFAVVDVRPKYNPPPSMLAGEPNVLEYKASIQKQLGDIHDNVSYKQIIPDNVGSLDPDRKTASTPGLAIEGYRCEDSIMGRYKLDSIGKVSKTLVLFAIHKMKHYVVI